METRNFFLKLQCKQQGRGFFVGFVFLINRLMGKCCRAVPRSQDSLCPQPMSSARVLSPSQTTAKRPIWYLPGETLEQTMKMPTHLNWGTGIFLQKGGHGKATRCVRQAGKKTRLLLPHQTWPRPRSFQALGCRRRALERGEEKQVGCRQARRSQSSRHGVGAAQHRRQRDPRVGVCRGGPDGTRSVGIAWGGEKASAKV